MIVNATDILPENELYKCKRYEMRYLMFVHKLPVIEVRVPFFYFVNNEELKKALKNRPWYMKVISWLDKKIG